jgi:hypothetical protein
MPSLRTSNAPIAHNGRTEIVATTTERLTRSGRSLSKEKIAHPGASLDGDQHAEDN